MLIQGGDYIYIYIYTYIHIIHIYIYIYIYVYIHNAYIYIILHIRVGFLAASGKKTAVLLRQAVRRDIETVTAL